MNQNNDPLDRLLASAAKATRPMASPSPNRLQSRVLADWRSSLANDDFALWVYWLRRAMAFAFCVVLMSAVWQLGSGTASRGDDLSLADSALQVAMDRP